MSEKVSVHSDICELIRNMENPLVTNFVYSFYSVQT